MTPLEELLEQARRGASPEVLKRLLEEEEKEARLKEERAEAGRSAHTRPPDPTQKLREAIRAFRRAAGALIHVHGAASLRHAAEVLGEAAEVWRRSRRRGPRPVFVCRPRRRRVRGIPTGQLLLPFE